MDHATIHSTNDASLFSLVRSAASTVSGTAKEPVGRLKITETGAEEQPKLSLEATVSAHGVGWKIEQLDVKWRAVSSDPVRPEVVRALLDQFGSGKYTNLTFADATGEIADLTLTFPSRFPFWGQLVTVARPALSTDERTTLHELLRTLGITDRSVRVASRKHLLGAMPTGATQAQVFGLTARSGMRVELYASALPATYAARIVQDWVTGTVPHVELCISYGLSGDRPPSTSDEQRTQNFLQQNFAVHLGDKEWQVTNAHGAEEEYRPHGTIPQSRKKAWSLNWGQR